MSYSGTKAQSGNQASLGIGSTPVVIGEITSLTQSGKMNATDDATNLESTAEEFIATLLKPGKFDVTMNRVPGDAGQAALLASFNAKTTVSYTAQLAMTPAQTTSGDKYVFNGLVEEFDDISEVKSDKKISSKASIKISGAVTLTAGA